MSSVEALRCVNCRETLVTSIKLGEESGFGVCPSCYLLHDIRKAEYAQEGGFYAVSTGEVMPSSVARELRNCLWHGEKWFMNQFAELAQRPAADLVRLCELVNQQRTDGLRLSVCPSEEDEHGK